MSGGLGGVPQATFGGLSQLGGASSLSAHNAARQQAAAGLRSSAFSMFAGSFYSDNPKIKTFKDELQDDVDEWLSGIKIKYA